MKMEGKGVCSVRDCSCWAIVYLALWYPAEAGVKGVMVLEDWLFRKDCG